MKSFIYSCFLLSTMSLVDRIKRFAKKSVVIPFFVGAALIAGCNTQQNTVPSCNPTIEENLAVKYAKNNGLEERLATLYSPLGEKCSLTDEDKWFIDFTGKDLVSKNEIGEEEIKGFVARFATDDNKISSAEKNAILYSYFNSYEKLIKVKNPEVKFRHDFVRGFISIDKIAEFLGLLDRDYQTGLTFPIIYGEGGNYYTFLYRDKTPDSDADCDTLFEAFKEGYDQVIYPPVQDLPFGNNSFIDWIVIRVSYEGTLRNDKGTYTILLKPLNPDKSLYKAVNAIQFAHAFEIEIDGVRKPPKIGDILPGIKVDENGIPIIGKYYYSSTTKPTGRVNYDVNVYSFTPYFSQPDNFEDFSGTNITDPEFKRKLYYIELEDRRFYPYNGFMVESPMKIAYVDNTRIIVDMTGWVSPGINVDPNGVDKTICKVEQYFTTPNSIVYNNY